MEEQKPQPKYYNDAVKKSIMKYREKNVEKYNEFSRNYYHKKKEDQEWKDNFNERCRLANQKYREKKKEQSPPKPRGRPRKVIIQETIA
jgi:hypothetical protein